MSSCARWSTNVRGEGFRLEKFRGSIRAARHVQHAAASRRICGFPSGFLFVLNVVVRLTEITTLR